jgi:signal transduction histidine kinase
VGRIEDVTGNRRRQEQVAVLDRVLRHNVRNKMGSIVGYLRSAVGGSAGDDTAVALEEATSLLALSEKARECHRLLEREPTRTRVEDLRDLLGPVVKRRREDFPEARISLETPAHPPVVADRELFVAAVMELVDNAVEHNDHERPTVGLRVEPAGEWVAVRVTDDGPGIPEAERRAILSGEEQPLYHASGLGVWFVKWAVRLVGGELDIADNEPRGTVVTLRLPTHPTVESTTATGDAGADAD